MFPTHWDGVSAVHLQSSLRTVILTADPCSVLPHPSHRTQHLICSCQSLDKAGSDITTRAQRGPRLFPGPHSKGDTENTEHTTPGPVQAPQHA